jgi:hypothetical protein
MTSVRKDVRERVMKAAEGKGLTTVPQIVGWALGDWITAVAAGYAVSIAGGPRWSWVAVTLIVGLG